jgi:hypothetical protein
LTVVTTIVMIVTFFVIRQVQHNKANEILDSFFRQYVPQEHWPEHLKPLPDPEMAEIEELRRKLKEQQEGDM